jgi:hypothetical protein
LGLPPRPAPLMPFSMTQEKPGARTQSSSSQGTDYWCLGGPVHSLRSGAWACITRKDVDLVPARSYLPVFLAGPLACRLLVSKPAQLRQNEREREREESRNAVARPVRSMNQSPVRAVPYRNIPFKLSELEGGRSEIQGIRAAAAPPTLSPFSCTTR